MRPLPNCIKAIAIIAGPALLLSASTAGAQQLEWVHSSQQKSRAAAPAVSRPPAARPSHTRVETKPLAAKQPTFRQPTNFKQPARAEAVGQHDQALAPPASMAPEAARQATPLRTAAAPPTPRAMKSAPTRSPQRRPQVSSRPAGFHGLASGVAPTQFEAIPTPAVSEGYVVDEGEYYSEGMPYAGEVGCGFPEPDCGCVGGCTCGDSCYVGDPGCGFPVGPGAILGEPGCAVGCSDGCCGECADGVCGCGDACCGDAVGGCGDACCDDSVHWPQAVFGCDERGCVPILWAPPIKEVVFFGGVQGFKNPLDGDRDGGNFGFNEGFNVGGKMAWLPWPGLGYQWGYRATQNQLSGDSNTMSDDSHSQHFVTAGLFQRSRLGLQYGVVWDMLNDERQGANNFSQVRGEISFRGFENRELGLAFAANGNSQVVNGTTYQSADQFLLFYRINGRQGGECRAFAGFSGDSEAIIGSDFHTPLTNRWSLEGNWAYLIPDSGNNGSAAGEEAWNIGMQLVWHYGCRAKSWHTRPYRPMFGVANNASLIVVD